MTKSSWETRKALSKYHFDNFKIDNNYDTVIRLGTIKGDWSSELKTIIDTSKSATWETRGYKGEGIMAPREDMLAEEYDLEKTGYSKDHKITHLNWNIPPVLKEISNLFGLDDCMERVHVQMPGEVWNLHLDKLEKWCPEEPWRIMRIMIQLTEWEQGHFWSYGNYNYSQWHSGDITTFDWQNVPHSTANAGHNPRVTYQLTGIITEKTNEFINRLKRFGEHRLYDTVSFW